MHINCTSSLIMRKFESKGQQTTNSSLEMKIRLFLPWFLFLFTVYAGGYSNFAVFQLFWLMYLPLGEIWVFGRSLTWLLPLDKKNNLRFELWNTIACLFKNNFVIMPASNYVHPGIQAKAVLSFFNTNSVFSLKM